MLARVSLPELLRRSVAPDVALRYRVSLLSDSSVPLASTTASATPEDALVYEVPIYLLPDAVTLQASAFRVRAPLMSHALAWVVAGLTIAVLVTLIALMRRDVRQARVERALRAETAFRRAMEDSLATGLAVIDRLGVIRHVNAAFCQMTGWQVTDLVGRGAPLPYWPPDQHAGHEAALNALLEGKAPTSGFELEVQRGDGSLFDARLYGSPLLSDDGEQLGWMTAMADITNPSASALHLRPHTSVSPRCCSRRRRRIGRRCGCCRPELLFANRAIAALSRCGGHLRLQRGLVLHGSGAGETYD